MTRPALTIVTPAPAPVEIYAELRARGTFADAQAGRGYHVGYRRGEVNHCPGCGRSHWWIGRITAECGFCGTAVQLADQRIIGGKFHVTVRRAVHA